MNEENGTIHTHKEIPPFVMTRMGPGGIVLSDIHQTEKDTLCVTSPLSKQQTTAREDDRLAVARSAVGARGEVGDMDAKLQKETTVKEEEKKAKMYPQSGGRNS